MSRNIHRLIYVILLIFIICFGLSSKRITWKLTEIIDLKDLIWSMSVYFIFRILLITSPLLKVAIISLALSFMIEASQLYHSEWIDSLRRTYFGELTLGSTFVWRDLLAYASGIVIGFVFDYILISLFLRKKTPLIQKR